MKNGSYRKRSLRRALTFPLRLSPRTSLVDGGFLSRKSSLHTHAGHQLMNATYASKSCPYVTGLEKEVWNGHVVKVVNMHKSRRLGEYDMNS